MEERRQLIYGPVAVSARLQRTSDRPAGFTGQTGFIPPRHYGLYCSRLLLSAFPVVAFCLFD